MPEYLAPGVYVEEVPSGNRPIQAASTSTAGVVGLTARGPVATPTLVSSRGAYARVFGGDLDPRVFTDGRDALPYAAEGFFVNGGSQLYVIRVVGAAAAASQLDVFAADPTVAAEPVLAAPAAEGDTELVIVGEGALVADTRLLLVDGEASEPVTVSADPFEPRVLVATGLHHDYAAADAVTPQTLAAVTVTLAAEAVPGDTTLTVDDTTALTAGTTYLVAPDDAGTAELVTVLTVDDATTVTLAQPLTAAHALTDTVSSLTAGTATQLTTGVTASAAAVLLQLDDGTGVAAGGVIELDNGTDSELALVSDIAQVVGLDAAVVGNHPAGQPLVPAVPVLTVHARYPGAWGDALRVGAGQSTILDTALSGPEGPASQTLTVDSAVGLYPGSVVVVGGTLVREVAAADITSGLVTLTEPHGQALTAGTRLVSREFSLTVARVEAGREAETEAFDQLSLHPEHPRYAPTVVGSWDAGQPSDSGASGLVRLTDTSDVTTRRLATVPGVACFLDGGDDDLAGVDDDAYIGQAAEDPAARTGIFALENEPTLSMVAVPGRTSVTVQKALIAHCDRMRYRFAVLDTPLGANLQAARTHRQNYDSTRAGVYYPGLEIADRFGPPGQRRAIPPSGHVLGIYARTDVARGVHKAPANEVVRGVLAFEEKLDKAAQDILNPINVNCFRDFRTENRGLRVYGARVVTSDPEWRYVNVRRLFLFLEQSLDVGLQWAVFEPNSERLWATVKQSVTSFLTTVWRSGALAGTTAEEAFFVNVGYDITMTQDDIDNGRLIVEVGAAPVYPAEFVILRIAQKTREAVG